LTSLEQQSAQIYSVVSAVDGDVQSLGELVKQFTQGVEQSNQAFNHIQLVAGEAMQAGEAVNSFSEKIVQASQSTATVTRDIAELANKTAQLTQVASERSAQINQLSAQLLETVQFFHLPSAIQDNTQPQPGMDSERLRLALDPTQKEEISLTVAVQEIPSSETQTA
jgi:methyl-accepting chemotaxis protein PixJ